MDYQYDVIHINKSERWITLSSNDKSDGEEPDAFISLLKMIQNKVKGEIVELNDMQYKILEDGIGNIYQWDGCFGISIIYPEDVELERVIDFLDGYDIHYHESALS